MRFQIYPTSFYFMKRCFFKLFILCSFAGFISNGYAQKTAAKISPKEYYAFFNSKINRDSIHAFYLESRPDFSFITNDTAFFSDSTLFSRADVAFIKKQIEIGKKFRWQSGKILGATVISSKRIDNMMRHEDGWERYHKSYKNGFVSLSVPLFTPDRNICIVYRAGRAGGLAGSGSTGIYRKVGGKWTFVGFLGAFWVS